MAKATKQFGIPVGELGGIDPNANVLAHSQVPAVAQICGTCSNWLRMSGPTMGQCKLSARAMPTMMVTTDLQSCSGWNELKQ